MKRVGCLYRVSTKKQVSDEDDIPMQKQACTEFAQRNGWIIVKEFLEKGISGFKVSANDRDVLQELKESALRNEFDILLVFMFDRLGRRDDETPFIVEWFCKHGIEVWSVKEGQQSFENHTDKLLNYIRFWQANGESEKTSERVKTRRRQLIGEGKFPGGNAPYGYKLIDTGEINRKGRAIRKLVVDNEKAEIVREVFDKTTNEGYGSHCLAEYLNSQGLTTVSDAKFTSAYINRMLKNKLYCGYFVSAGVVSPKQEYLKIIEEEQFEEAQKILEQRGKRQERKINVAMTTQSDSLLSGNIFCGHCGARLCASKSNYKTHVINGTPVREYRRIYICYHRSRRLNDCNGQSVYQAEKVEGIVLDILHSYFRAFKHAKCDTLEANYAKTIEEKKKSLRQLKHQKAAFEKQQQALNDEIGKVLVGESAWSVSSLQSAISDIEKKLSENEKLIEQYSEEIENVSDIMDHVDYHYERFNNFADEFDKVSVKQQKMIICELFEKITVKRGYEIAVVLNRDYEQFLC